MRKGEKKKRKEEDDEEASDGESEAKEEYACANVRRRPQARGRMRVKEE